MSRKDEEIRETKLLVALRAEYKCEICEKKLPLGEGELAHKIPQRKHLIEKFGKGVIHHALNFQWTCPGCNSAASLGTDKGQQALAGYIRLEIFTEAAVRIQAQPHLHTALIDKLAKIAGGE